MSFDKMFRKGSVESTFEQLEERVLFDGVPDACVVQPEADASEMPPAQMQTADSTQLVDQQLVIVDPRAENADALVASILDDAGEANVELLTLDESRDGIAQISDLLDSADGRYSSVHIVASGEDGEVRLGRTRLNDSTLGRYVPELAQWSTSLHEGAEVQFYGAELESYQAGEELLESIGAVTGAAVSDATMIDNLQIIFVDGGVENADELIREAREGIADDVTVEIYDLSTNRDGLVQISEVLEGRTGIDAIHIVSHGDEGEVRLGNTVINSENLSEYEAALAGWSDVLSEDADLLFYGCELAGNAEGEAFLESVSEITGADVAASDDLTGAAELGGDWELEFTIGALETSAISARSFQGILATGPVPTAVLDVPSDEFINEGFEFTVGFDNASADPNEVGFAPYIDLSVPGGVDLSSASFLGSNVTLNNVGSFDAAGNLVDSAGNPLLHPITGLAVTGTPGETLYVLEVPFGSFVPDQPVAEFTIQASLDSASGAVVGSPLDIDATAGFALGSDPLDNVATDPPIIGATTTDSITPQVIDLVKQSNIDDGVERATGPNYPIVYTLVVDIADGETVDNIEIADFLPDSFVFIGGSLNVDSSNATAASGLNIADEPVAGSPQNAPDNNILVEFGSVTGSSSDEDIVVTYTVFVDSVDANGNPVIDPITGDRTVAVNDSSVIGTYEGNPVGDDGPETDSRVEQSSLATQKSVAIVNDTGGAGATPGDTLQYTIDVQVSDFFEFSNVVLDDNYTDGQSFDASFVPTFVITEGGVTTSGTFAAGNFTVTAGAAGSTDVFFDVSGEVADGTLTGDLFADSTNDG